jgi:hypothetical protein
VATSTPSRRVRGSSPLTLTKGKHSSIYDSADTYLIEDGRIVAQTIHYTVTSRQLTMNHPGDDPDDDHAN